MNTHHDYTPGARVQVQIARNGCARWYAATFLGTRVGASYHAIPYLQVQTRDGKVWHQCCAECVRPA